MRVLLAAAPGCVSSLVALMSSVAAVVSVVSLSNVAQQMGQNKNTPPTTATSVSFSDASTLATEFADQPVFSGTFDRPVDYSDPLLAQRKIVIATDINPHTTREVVSKLLYLNQKSSTQPINLYLRTNGGKYNDAFAIIDTMHLIQAPVNVWAVGNCWSAGAVILTAATGKRLATRHAEIMVHANLDVPAGAQKNNEDAIDKARVGGIYEKYAHLPTNWVPLTGGKEYYITAQSAKVYGIIDEIR